MDAIKLLLSKSKNRLNFLNEVLRHNKDLHAIKYAIG